MSLEFKSLEDVCLECTISRPYLLKLIVREWISPADPERHCFDEEDIARIRLIKLLSDELEIDETAIPVILNLIDQVHVLRKMVRAEMKIEDVVMRH